MAFLVLYPQGRAAEQERIGATVAVYTLFQKKPHVRKISARNSGTGNGCTNFVSAWHVLVLSAGKPPCP